jgi:glycosyltransferase involved in cell wall biosynthesis
MEIFFSVIIPVYNTEAYIRESIESAINQHGVKHEIIVVNDGSTDKSLVIAKSFGNQVKIYNQKNMGLSAARNSGANIASGNYLAFLDADDVWMPGKLLAQSNKIMEGYNIVYTNRINIGQIRDLPEIHSDIVKMPEGDIWRDLLFGNMITASSSVILKELYRDIGGFNNDLRSCEDWDLWLRCSENNLIGFCPDPLVKYRFHSGGLSKNYMFMSQMREKVITSALNSDRGKALSQTTKLKVLANTWAASAWDAALAKDIVQSLRFYWKALRLWPFDSSTWYNIARALAGRI